MNLTYLLIFQCGLFYLSKAWSRSISGSISPSGAAAPPTHRVARRTASQQATVEYTLITINSPDCKGFPVDNFPVRVQYRLTANSGLTSDRSREWISLESIIAKSSNGCDSFPLTPSVGDNDIIRANVRSYSAVIPNINPISDNQRVQLRLVQSDHRGGFCDCWAVSDLTLRHEDSTVHDIPQNRSCATSGELYASLSAFLGQSGSSDHTVTCTNYTISADTSVLGFCRGSASVPRGFVSVELGAETQPPCENTAAVVDTGRLTPLMGHQCNSMPHVEIFFFLNLMPDSSALDSLDEGVEFGYRINNNEWIPLAWYSTTQTSTVRDNFTEVGRLMDSNLMVRGFNVSVYRIMGNTRNPQLIKLTVCGSEIIEDDASLSFRWLQTVNSSVAQSIDDIAIDNVQIDIKSSTLQLVLLMDNFDNQMSINSSKWTDIDRATIHNSQLVFGAESPMFDPLPPAGTDRRRRTIISRRISTVPLHLSFQIQLSYTLITASSPDCPNTDPAPPPRLEYRANGSQSWTTIEPDNISATEEQYMSVRSYSTSIGGIVLSALPVQVRLVQLDHHGGSCDCWAVANLTVTPPNGQATELSEVCGGTTSEAFQSLLERVSNQTLGTLGDGIIAGFCGDNEGIPQVFIAQFGSTPLQGLGECNSSGLVLETTTEDEGTDMTTTNTINTLKFESDVRDSIIMENGNFSSVLVQIEENMFTSAIVILNDVLYPNSITIDDTVNVTQAAYLLSAIVNGFGNQIVGADVSQLILSVASRLLEIAQNRVESGTDVVEDLAGSTLLQTIDKFTLNNHNVSHQIKSDNIVFQVEEVSLNDTDLDDDTFSGVEVEGAEIRIPREVLRGNPNPVRMASLLFRNMSGLLPARLEGNNDGDSDDLVFRLASPVISASFQCDTCTTSNLSTPVQVTFRHTEYDQALVDNDSESSIKCVFWDFDDEVEQQPGAILYPGRWSDEGCETNFNSTMTVCKCNHLTHFAILLSARPLDLSQAKTLALQITGYIGVSISLVAMTITVIVFIFLKALRTMRNYIHIQLCVTLAIAQIIFVAGIEPRLGEGHLVGGVPVGCRLVAVLLHYWFLVSFMWMLMEGVVLYVALVRVFIKYHARYIAAFTIASYGLPLLYVGGLTVPLGFARSEEIRRNQTYDYGYEQACYLNPTTKFIWSFIVPVILIFLANVGFFIMAAIIMNRHQKRQHDKSTVQRVRHWLRVTVSLTVVMGITWIIGVLVIEVDELFPLAYIFTIFVAFQGLFIFVIFVLLSKQVRENYLKWWKVKVAGSDFLSSHFGEKHPTLGTYASGSAQSQSLPLHDKTGNKQNMKDGGISNGYHVQSPDVEDSNKFSFNVTYVPSSSVTKDTENGY